TLELGELPLALDLAGAYIQEVRCSLQEYQQQYRRRRMLLLKQRGGLGAASPEEVSTACSFSFEQVEQKSPGAADLLRLLAFLHADAIPVELIVKGTAHPGSFLVPVAEDDAALDETIAILEAYSLVRRDVSEGTLWVHRLVQAGIRDTMNEISRKQWAE